MMKKEKVVLISGAAGRLGSACTKKFLTDGYAVIGMDKSESGLKRLEEEVESENLYTCMGDITVAEDIDQAIKYGLEIYGGVKAAVHCAYPRSSSWGTPFEELNIDNLTIDLKLQLGGAIIFSQRVLRHFASQKSGVLVHVSSIQGIAAPKFEHYEGTSIVSPIEYSAIKSGIISITQYLAKINFDKGIRVNCVSPGGILDGQPENFLAKYRKSCNAKGMLDAMDVAGTVSFLVSDESKYITGQNIVVDDGWSL